MMLERLLCLTKALVVFFLATLITLSTGCQTVTKVGGDAKAPIQAAETSKPEVQSPRSSYGMLVVNTESWKTLDEFLKAAKARTLIGGISAIGEVTRPAALATVDVFGIKVTLLTFAGAGEFCLTALVAKHIDFSIVPSTIAIAFIQAGKIRPLVMFSDMRDYLFPEVPTAKELGYAVPRDVGSRPADRVQPSAPRSAPSYEGAVLQGPVPGSRVKETPDEALKAERLIIKDIVPFKKVGRVTYGATYVKFISATQHAFVSLGTGTDSDADLPNITTIIRRGERSVRIETDTGFIPSVTGAGAHPFMLALKEGARFRFVGEIPCFLVKSPNSSVTNVYPYPADPPFKLSLTFSEGSGEYTATPLTTPYVKYKKIIFRGDNVNPLTFVLKDTGLVYIGGKGEVIFPDGKKEEVGK